MNQNNEVSVRQLSMICLLSLALNAVVRPFVEGNGASAQVIIPAEFLTTICLLLLLWGLQWCTGLVQQETLRDGSTEGSQVFLGCCVVLFALEMGAGIRRTERFFSYVSDEPLPQMIIYLLVFAVAFYAMRCGLSAIGRLFGLLMWIFAASIVLLVIANVQQMQMENLTVNPFSVSAILQATAQKFSLSPILVLFFFFSFGKPVQKKKTAISRVLWLLFGFSVVLTVVAELVLGERAHTQMQNVYALSRLGRISVFKRMDVIHIAAWMMLAFGKAAALGVGIKTALEPLLRMRQRKNSVWYAQLLGALGLLCVRFIDETTVKNILTIGTLIVFLVMAILGCKIRWKHEKKD